MGDERVKMLGNGGGSKAMNHLPLTLCNPTFEINLTLYISVWSNCLKYQQVTHGG